MQCKEPHEPDLMELKNSIGVSTHTLFLGKKEREWGGIHQEQHLFLLERRFRGAFIPRLCELISFFSVRPNPTSDKGEYQCLRHKALYGRVNTQ